MKRSRLARGRSNSEYLLPPLSPATPLQPLTVTPAHTHAHNTPAATPREHETAHTSATIATSTVRITPFTQPLHSPATHMHSYAASPLASPSASLSRLPRSSSGYVRYKRSSHATQAEAYGFVLWITTFFAYALYMAWAFVPSEWLHAVGITYFPDKQWALAIPSYLIMLLCFIVISYAAYNMLNTLPADSIYTIAVNKLIWQRPACQCAQTSQSVQFTEQQSAQQPSDGTERKEEDA